MLQTLLCSVLYIEHCVFSSATNFYYVYIYDDGGTTSNKNDESIVVDFYTIISKLPVYYFVVNNA